MSLPTAEASISVVGSIIRGCNVSSVSLPDTVSLLLVETWVVVVAVVGSIHSVLLAADTHCEMCVPLDKVQLMKMKPTGTETHQP